MQPTPADLAGNQPTSPSREVINAFRFFIGIRLVVALVSAGLSYSFSGGQQIEFANQLAVLETALLLIYLSLPALRRRLKAWHLPIALAVATLGPIVENILFLRSLLALTATTPALTDEFTRQALFAGQFQLSIVLLVPLILVAWLYSYRVTAAYVLGITALDILIPVVLLNGGSFAGLWRLSAAILFRTLLYLFFGYLINRLVAGQKRQNLELTAANQRLSRYATTLEQLAVSHERNRLAREFHDTLAHTLSAVAVQLEAVSALQKTNPAKAAEMLEQSLAITRSGLGETRRAILALRAAPLEDLGLRGALESLARSSAERFGWELHLDLAEELNGLTPEVEHSLYRIVEEALRNAGDHASARRLDLSLRRVDSTLELTLADDGAGFTYDPAALDDRFGLRGMHERARAIGGELSIASTPGQGTRLRLVLKEPA